MAENRVIGLNQQIPWHLSADLKKFKQITMGNPILMGRKTYESIGRPLPGRKNIIISRNLEYQQAGCEVFSDVQQAIEHYKNYQELFVIGGSAFYESMLNKAHLIYVTQIHKPFDGDTFFPEINKSQWLEVERQDIEDDDSVDFSYSFIKLQRV